MLERFSADANSILAAAQQEATSLGHEYVGTEHLLLALLSGKGVPKRALESLGVKRRQLQSEIERVIARGEATPRPELLFTPAAEGALRRSVQEAQTEGQEQVESRHLLLGVSGEDDGLAARILFGMDISVEQVRSAVAQEG